MSSDTTRKWFKNDCRRLFQAGLLTGIAVTSLTGQPVAAQDLSQPGVAGTFRLFQFDPATPEELLRGIRIAQQLDRITEARAWLRQLSERDPQSPELVALRREAGLATFVGFATDRRLQPEAGTLLTTMRLALPQLSSAELTERATRLGTPGRTRDDAVLDLLAAGDASLPVLLAVPANTPAGDVAADLLEQWSVDFRAGLLELLSATDSANQVRILNLLGRTRRSELTFRLLRWQHAGGSAEVREAAGVAIQRLHGTALANTADEAIEILLMQAEKALHAAGQRQSSTKLSPVTVTVDSRLFPGNLQQAVSLISDALAINPEHTAGLLLQFVATAAAVPPEHSKDPSVTADESDEMLLAALAKSLDLEQGAAAVECLKELSRRSLSNSQASTPEEVLGRAVKSADARVRILASTVIRARGLNPPGARTGVLRTLAAAKAGALKPEAVVIAPDSELALTLRQLLEDQQFAVTTARTGPQGFEAAAAQMNCELVFLSMYPSRWPASATIANLRADCRTRLTPIVLVGPEAKRAEAEALSAVHAGVEFLAEPLGTLTFPSQFQALSIPAPLLNTADREALQTAAE